MTDQTEAAEVLSRDERQLVRDIAKRVGVDGAISYFEVVLAARVSIAETAAEARGAEYALLKAAEDCLNIAFEQNEDVQDWLAARAAATGGGS